MHYPARSIFPFVNGRIYELTGIIENAFTYNMLESCRKRIEVRKVQPVYLNAFAPEYRQRRISRLSYYVN